MATLQNYNQIDVLKKLLSIKVVNKICGSSILNKRKYVYNVTIFTCKLVAKCASSIIPYRYAHGKTKMDFELVENSS